MQTCYTVEKLIRELQGMDSGKMGYPIVVMTPEGQLPLKFLQTVYGRIVLFCEIDTTLSSRNDKRSRGENVILPHDLESEG